MKVNKTRQVGGTFQSINKAKASDGKAGIKDSMTLSPGKTEGESSLKNIGNKVKTLFGQVKGLEGAKEALADLKADGPAAGGGISNSQAVAQLNGYLASIMNDPEAEAEMINMLAGLNATGQLRPVLLSVSETAVQSGNFPPFPDEKRIEMVYKLSGMIDAEFRSHGMTPETHGRVYKTWEDMGKEHVAMVRNSKVPPRGPGELSAFTDPKFIKELETLQGASFEDGNSVTPLINGPASFAERNRLIDGARKSIHMMTWAFYDDDTGWDVAKRLVAKHKEGLDVQVTVDALVASTGHHGETIKFLEEQGVKVVRWTNPDEPYQGQHRKLLVVDGEAAVAGGLNPGNVYSHMGAGDEPKWRDTDVLLKGPAVAECERLFSSVAGNEEKPVVTPAAAGKARVATVNHCPGKDAHIMLANMKAIQGASESIDIENAYFIETPGMKQVIMDALKRGVKVRILTNSGESVDEPIVSAPILKSLPELVEAGAEIYTKKGDTLHSKFMVVDGIYSSVGSYNMHPRSERYEGEMTLNTLDTETAKDITKAFEKDISEANRIESADQIQVQENALTMIASRYFFDQL